MNNNDNKLAEAIEKIVPIFAEYVRILQQQQQITKQQTDNMQSNQSKQSNQSNQTTQSAGSDGDNFFSGIWNTITAPFNWLHRQEESEYARMTTLDPAKSGESEVNNFSKYGYVIPEEQMKQLQTQVKNQQDITKQNIDNYDKGVTRGIAHDMERRKDKLVQEVSQDVQESLQNSTAKETISSFNDEIRRSMDGMDDILRAASIHNVNHLGE